MKMKGWQWPSPQFGHLAMFWPWQMQTCAVRLMTCKGFAEPFRGPIGPIRVCLKIGCPNIWGIYRDFQHEVTQYAILGCGCSISVILPIIPYEHILALNNAIFPATYALQAPPFSHWGAQIGQLQLVQIDDPKARHRLLQRFLRMQTIGWWGGWLEHVGNILRTCWTNRSCMKLLRNWDKASDLPDANDWLPHSIQIHTSFTLF